MILQPEEVCKFGSNCPNARDPQGNPCFGLDASRENIFTCDICQSEKDCMDKLGYKTTPINESGNKKVLLEG